MTSIIQPEQAGNRPGNGAYRMNDPKNFGFNVSLVLAACILAVGLIIAALIVTHGRGGTAQAGVTAPPSEDSVRQQFLSQMQAQLAGHPVESYGKTETLQSISIDKVEFATNGDKIAIQYEVHWQSNSTSGTGCVLTRNDFGHYTNADNISTAFDNFQPHIDIQ